jgi:uncharacterized membrane protein YdjX (TVP38/TMEM64 family)
VDPSVETPAVVKQVNWLARIAGVVAFLVLVAAFALVWDPEAFQEWKQEAGPLPFFAALAVLPAFGVPTTPFYLLAGATFGVAGGLAGSAISLALNLLLCFWIARGALRRWLQAALARTKYRLPEQSDRRVIRFALLVKFTPGAPTFIKTYLIAISGVPFWLYFLLSYTVTMVYAAGFIVLGESMLDRDFSQAAWALGALVLLAVVVGVVVRRTRGRPEAELPLDERKE